MLTDWVCFLHSSGLLLAILFADMAFVRASYSQTNIKNFGYNMIHEPNAFNP
jgi:hypothetical protein